MASTSNNSSSMRICKHDVFLSFRGPDTRNTIIDHLYHHLTLKCISVFKDDQSLRIGDSISQQLLQAIQDSRVSIVVFSRRYADSPWCLDEMAAIYECRNQFKQTVIPVFYDVDPSYVRWRFKYFDYDDCEKISRISKSDPDRLNRWNTAMTELAGLAGFDLRFRGEFGEVEKIVQAVIKTLGQKFSMLPNDLVGMQPRVEELEKSPPPVVTTVLKIRMPCICNACTQVFQKDIPKLEGVESVEIDLENDQAIVKGVIDPAKLVDEVYKRTKKLATIVEEEKKEEEKKEEKKEEIKEEEKKESEEEKKEEEKKEEEKKYSNRHKSPPVVTIVLKIRMHCDACPEDFQKKIRKIKGVESVEIDLGNDQAIVKGVFDPAKLVDEVFKRTRKQATIVKEEEKKEEEKKEEEKKKKEEIKEEKKESEEEKKEEEKKEEEKKEEIRGASSWKREGAMAPPYYIIYIILYILYGLFCFVPSGKEGLS